VQEPDPAWQPAQLRALARPILDDSADVVVAARVGLSAPERALAALARKVAQVEVADPLSTCRAFRTQVLRDTDFKEDIDAGLLVKVAAQLYRFDEVPAHGAVRARTPSEVWSLSRTLLRYATTDNDADNAHEGYTTLARIESGAPNYNAWLGRRFRAHAGARVLEVGAGIGTITALLAEGRQKVVALEVDPFYVRRLQNRFRGTPQVVPYLSDVALADFQTLAKERFDSIVLSNVMEHIPDDAGAVRRFGQILAPGGKVLILVPALPAIFGALDEAVGHYRRYTPSALRKVLDENGFEVEQLQWMNLIGIPGWFVNGKLLRRRAMPPLQLRIYDQLAPYLARAESKVKLPVGMSLFCVARKR
jgi:SAM-dependent methyltransferase